MVAGFCCNTAVCGDGVLNLLSEGHWRGSRKRFNQPINQPLWSSSLSSLFILPAAMKPGRDEKLMKSDEIWSDEKERK